MFSPFPFTIDSFANNASKSEIARKIDDLKWKLRNAIQSQFPILGPTPIVDFTAQNYMSRYFDNQPMGQDWKRNVQIQQMLMELNLLEKELKKMTQKSNDWQRMERYKQLIANTIKQKEQKEKNNIHSAHTGTGVPKFVGKYTHGIDDHSDKMQRQVETLHDREKREAKRRAGKDTPDSVRRRIDKYDRKELDIVRRNEEEEHRRIKRDHHSSGVPRSVRGKDHDYKDHTRKLVSAITRLQEQEKKEVDRKFKKSVGFMITKALTAKERQQMRHEAALKRLQAEQGGAEGAHAPSSPDGSAAPIPMPETKKKRTGPTRPPGAWRLKDRGLPVLDDSLVPLPPIVERRKKSPPGSRQARKGEYQRISPKTGKPDRRTSLKRPPLADPYALYD